MTDLTDFESNLRQLKDFQQKVILVPEHWRAFAPAEPLTWDRVRFTPENKAGVPEQRGIYAFVVQFQDDRQPPLALPPHGYLMYAGITGEKAEDRTLFDRYGDYALGASRQRSPLRLTNTMPLRTRRSSTRGLPWLLGSNGRRRST